MWILDIYVSIYLYVYMITYVIYANTCYLHT